MASKNTNKVPLRQRGRPAGKNRIPLSKSERRARNALYERQRRMENNEALTDLADAVGYHRNGSNIDILAFVVNYLHTVSRPEDDIEELKRCNKNLVIQIESLEQRLACKPGDSSSEYSTADEELIIRTHSNTIGTKKTKIESQAEHMQSEPTTSSDQPDYRLMSHPHGTTLFGDLTIFKFATSYIDDSFRIDEQFILKTDIGETSVNDDDGSN